MTIYKVGAAHDIFSFLVVICQSDQVFMNEVLLGNVVYADFIELVVKHDARPERPDDSEASTLTATIWEVAEKCWVEDPRKRPTASAACDIVSRLLGTNVPPTSQVLTHTARPRRVPHSSSAASTLECPFKPRTSRGSSATCTTYRSIF